MDFILNLLVFKHKVHNNLAHGVFPSTVNLHWLHITKQLNSTTFPWIWCTWAGTTWSSNTGWAENGSRQGLEKKTWGCLWVKRSIWPSSACFQPRMPTISWAVSKELQPAGQGILPLYFILLGPHLKLWGLNIKNNMDLLAQVQREASELIRGLKHIPCEDRLRELGLFTLEKKRLQEDLTAPSWCQKLILL